MVKRRDKSSPLAETKELWSKRRRDRKIPHQSVDRRVAVLCHAFGTAILAGLMVFMLRENRTERMLVPAAE